MSASKVITNVYVFQNGMAMVFDQYGQQMPEYQGYYVEVKDKIAKDYSGKINENIEWRR